MELIHFSYCILALIFISGYDTSSCGKYARQIECPQLSIENGQVCYDWTEHEQMRRQHIPSTATIKCHPSFLLNGSRILICNSSMSWDKPVPTCEMEGTSSLPSLFSSSTVISTVATAVSSALSSSSSSSSSLSSLSSSSPSWSSTNLSFVTSRPTVSTIDTTPASTLITQSFRPEDKTGKETHVSKGLLSTRLILYTTPPAVTFAVIVLLVVTYRLCRKCRNLHKPCDLHNNSENDDFVSGLEYKQLHINKKQNKSDNMEAWHCKSNYNKLQECENDTCHIISKSYSHKLRTAAIAYHKHVDDGNEYPNSTVEGKTETAEDMLHHPINNTAVEGKTETAEDMLHHPVNNTTVEGKTETAEDMLHHPVNNTTVVGKVQTTENMLHHPVNNTTVEGQTETAKDKLQHPVKELVVDREETKLDHTHSNKLYYLSQDFNGYAHVHIVTE